MCTRRYVATTRSGAAGWDHQQERGYEFWVLRDPWGNEFCAPQTNSLTR